MTPALQHQQYSPPLASSTWSFVDSEKEVGPRGRSGESTAPCDDPSGGRLLFPSTEEPDVDGDGDGGMLLEAPSDVDLRRLAIQAHAVVLEVAT